MLGQSQQGRVLALANLTLASLRNQQGRTAEILQPARAAEAYYRPNGYVFEADLSTLLIGRAQRDEEKWQDALQTANGLIALADQSGRNGLLVTSEDLEGTIYIAMEDYPGALGHYQIAISRALDNGTKSFEAAHCADAFVRLGQFSDAKRMLGLAPPSSTLAAEISVESLLAQLKFESASQSADMFIGKFPGMSFGRKRNIKLDQAIAEAATGRTAKARQGLQSLLAPDGLPRDEDGKPLAPDDLAAFELAAARIDLADGDAKAALGQATRAESYFESKHLLDSELRSSLVAAQAASKLNETATYKQFSEKSVDIHSELSHTWPSPEFNSYVSRPDLKSQLREIVR